jgi:chemotaxis protein MotC
MPTAVAAADIDPATTGSVAEEAPTPAARAESAPQPAEVAAVAPAVSAEPVPPPAAPPVMVAAEGDDLLGSPSSFDLGPQDVTPSAPGPAGIDVPMRNVGPEIAIVPEPGKPLPEAFALVRSLQMLQDRMAAGDIDAMQVQRPLRTEIDRAFARLTAANWQDRRNAEAAVTYVLSGGAPTILETLRGIEPKPPVDERLVDGVLQYATGNVGGAAVLLEVDARDVPASMAGQVAIAQSALVVKDDPARAMRLLSLARLLAPGTLVEEAAIRRELFVADQQHDDDAVQSLARQYLDRFRHSVYAGNFRARFAAALSHMRSLDREDSFAGLDDMLAMVEPDARCELYLTVALASTVSNRLTAARLAAERASGLALAGSVQEARARLYHAAALAALPGMVDTADSDLKGLNPALLSSPDRALLDVVTVTVAGVRSATNRASIKVAIAEPLGDGSTADEPAVLGRARQALADTDALVATK